MPDHLEVREGIGRFHPRGRCSLVDAVELVASAIAYCRDHRVEKLLVDTTDLVGVAIPSLLDRFLMAEEWAEHAEGSVTVAMVARPEYIHPKRFGVRVAADFGLVAEIYTSADDALKWLSSDLDPGYYAA